MKNKLYLVGFFLLMVASCASNSSSGIFSQPATLAIDATNDRLIVIENLRQVFVLKASNRNNIGSQPVVKSDRLESIYDLLPISPLQTAVYADGSISRLFVTGAIANEAGNSVLNRILVLDFDGTTFTESSLSPLDLDDSDDATTDTDNVPGGLLVDQDNGRLFVTDSSAGLLYVFNADDGSSVVAPIAIAGNPNKMSLVDNLLFVANASTEAAERVVTVVDTDDFTTTTFDLEVPLTDISVVPSGTSYVLLAKDASDNKVLIRSVSADFATITLVAATSSSFVDGSLSAGLGLTSSVGGLLMTSDANGSLFGYVSQNDGTIDLVSFSSNASTYAVTELSTVTQVITTPTVYGTSIVYMIAETSGDLIYTDVGSSSVEARF